MKRIISALCLCLAVTAASAQYTKSIMLTAGDGTQMTLALTRALQLRFDNDQLIASDGTQQFTFSLDGIKINYSTDDATGVVSMEQADAPVVRGNALLFKGLKPGTRVQVYQADGKLISDMPADGGQLELPLQSLPKGVSVVRAGKYALKYMHQ